MIFEMEPQEWLKINYGLEVGSTINYNGLELAIKSVKETDNIGHFRTQYPVVIGIDNPDSIFPEKTEWITIEAVFQY